jgi:hypothetical protein
MTIREIGNSIFDLFVSVVTWMLEAIVLFVRFEWLDLGILQAIALLAVLVSYFTSRAKKDAEYVEDVVDVMVHGVIGVGQYERNREDMADDIAYLRRVEKSGIQYYFYKGLVLISICLVAFVIGYGLTENNADRGVQWAVISAIAYLLRCYWFRHDVRESLKREGLSELKNER